MDFLVQAQIVPDEVLSELREIIAVVFDVQPILIAFEIVERNCAELLSSVEKHVEAINRSSENMVAVELMLEGLVSSSQRINNFLAAGTAFLAQTETQIRIVHGEGSAELDAWTVARNYAHATSFAYRFLYELRNFAQHSTLPLSSINVDAARAHVDAPMAFRADLLMSRDGLLTTGYNWKKRLRDDIEQQQPTFEILPLVSQYMKDLRRLCLEAVKYEEARLANCARYLDVLRTKLQVPEGAIPVVFVGDSKSKEVPPAKCEWIPMGQFVWLVKRFAEAARLLECG